MEKNYYDIETTSEVYNAILHSHHKNLVVFSSYTNEGIAETWWGFKDIDTDTPILHALSKWDSYDDSYSRINEVHKYWLCIPKSKEED